MRELGDLRAREIYHGARLPRSTDSFLPTLFPDMRVTEPNSLIGPVPLSVEASSIEARRERTTNWARLIGATPMNATLALLPFA